MSMNRFLILSAAVLAVMSCAGNRQQKPAVSTEGTDTIPALQENRVRAEGTGTSVNVQMATEIARMNAMTVLACKVSPADTLTEYAEDGSIVQTETVSTPVFDVRQIDRRVYRDSATGNYTVWILLEARKEH